MKKCSLRGILRFASVVFCGVLAVATAGCGGDDDLDEPTIRSNKPDSGTKNDSAESGGSTSNRRGSGGSFAWPTTGASGRGQTESAALCNGKTCAAPSGSMLQPCCLPNGECGGGYQQTCQPWQMEGDVDTRCPDHNIAELGATLKGCCKKNGNCGVMSSSGLGCIERTDLAAYAGGPLNALKCNVSDSGI